MGATTVDCHGVTGTLRLGFFTWLVCPLCGLVR